jgi:hypothetical protein
MDPGPPAESFLPNRVPDRVGASPRQRIGVYEIGGGRIRTADLLLPKERGGVEERVREDTPRAESPANLSDQQLSLWTGDEPAE